jgi:hypothetical protein
MMRRYTRYPRRQTSTEAIEFDVTIDGRDALIGFTRHTVGGWDNYGADADGRRGVMRYDYEDDYDKVTLAFYDDNAELLHPTPIENLSKELAKVIDDKIAKYIADHAPADMSDGEPDMDDIDD